METVVNLNSCKVNKRHMFEPFSANYEVHEEHRMHVQKAKT